MRLGKILAPLAIIVILLAAPGCGSEESALTKPQFIQQGDAVCRRAAAEQARLASHYKKGEVAAGNFEVVTTVFVPPMSRELRRLKALSPPQADAARIRRILKALESGLEDAKTDYLDLFVKETDPFAKANELAQRYGLNACAKSSQAVIKPQG
jgi:hypothetical protein